MRLLGDFIFLRQNPTYKKSIKNKQTTFIQISYTLRKHKKVNKQLLFIKSKKKQQISFFLDTFMKKQKNNRLFFLRCF